MVFQDIKYKIQGLSEVAGLEILFDKEGNPIFTYALFELKSGELLLKEHEEYRSLALLQEKINTKTPVILTLSGKGVLTKHVPRLENGKSFLQHVLPNAKEEELSLIHI